MRKPRRKWWFFGPLPLGEWAEVEISGNIQSEPGTPYVHKLRGVIGTYDIWGDRGIEDIKIWPSNPDDPQLPPGYDNRLWFNVKDSKITVLKESLDDESYWAGVAYARWQKRESRKMRKAEEIHDSFNIKPIAHWIEKQKWMKKLGLICEIKIRDNYAAWLAIRRKHVALKPFASKPFASMYLGTIACDENGRVEVSKYVTLADDEYCAKSIADPNFFEWLTGRIKWLKEDNNDH